MEEVKKTTAKKKSTPKKVKITEDENSKCEKCCECANNDGIVDERTLLLEKIANLERTLVSKKMECKVLEKSLNEEKEKNKKLNDVCRLHERKALKYENDLDGLLEEYKAMKCSYDELRELLAREKMPWYKRLFIK